MTQEQKPESPEPQTREDQVASLGRMVASGILEKAGHTFRTRYLSEQLAAAEARGAVKERQKAKEDRTTTEGISYHDVYVTLDGMERTRLFDLPYGYSVTCSRTTGWRVMNGDEEVGSEYGPGRLTLDVGGYIIVGNDHYLPRNEL